MKLFSKFLFTLIILYSYTAIASNADYDLYCDKFAASVKLGQPVQQHNLTEDDFEEVEKLLKEISRSYQGNSEEDFKEKCSVIKNIIEEKNKILSHNNIDEKDEFTKLLSLGATSNSKIQDQLPFDEPAVIQGRKNICKINFKNVADCNEIQNSNVVFDSEKVENNELLKLMSVVVSGGPIEAIGASGDNEKFCDKCLEKTYHFYSEYMFKGRSKKSFLSSICSAISMSIPSLIF
jgi:hypothetical protein